MADLGDKVGDVYVEVHAQMDKRALASTEAQLNKYASKVQRDLNKKLGNDFTRQIDATLKAAAKSEFAAQNRTIQALDRQRQRSIAQNEKNQADAVKRQLQRVRNMNEEIERAHGAALRDDIIRTKKLEDEKNRILTRNRKRYKDGGLPNLGESIENVISILPGQLEKLFRNPYIAAGAVAIGAGLAGFIAEGLAAGLAGAVGGGIVIGAIVGLVKNDADVQAAYSRLGDRAMSAFLNQAVKFKPQVIDLFDSIGSDISGFINGLDLSQLIGSIGPIKAGITDFLNTIRPGFQYLIDIGGPILRDLFKDVLPGIGEAFTRMSSFIKENGDSVRIMLKAIGKGVEAILVGFGYLVKFGSGLVRTIGKVEMAVVSLARSAAIAWNNVADKVPGLGGAKIDTSGFDATLANIAANMDKYNDFSYVLGDVGTSLNNVATDSKNAAAAGHSLAEQQTILADAYQTAFDKQQQFDQGLRTGLETQQTWTEFQADIATALKTNGKTLDQNTVKGANNAKAIEAGFRRLKESYAEDVKNGKISADKAKAQFDRRAKAILDKFDKNSPTYKTLTDFYKHLDDFPKVISPKVALDTSAAEANIARLKAKLKGLEGEGARKKAAADLDKNAHANGGPIFGPGTATSDSIPANLSNGEFVIKASSAKKIGYANLARMNSTGKTVSHFATGGVAGNGRGSSASEKNAYEALLKQIATLNKTITAQSKALEAYNNQLSASREQFKSFVNLGALDTQGKSTGDILQQLQQRKAKTGAFTKNLAALKGKGLSATALQQIAEAGPDSDIAKLVLGGSKYDIGLINKLLGGESSYANSIGNTIFPKGKQTKAQLAANKKKLAARQKQAAKLKPVKAKGATISYAGGKVSALFSSKELAQQQLKTGTYVTVVIDGKEVRAIVKEEQKKVATKSNRQMKSGRK